MYKNGFCPVDTDGTPLACPEAYGALLGTAACCALLEIVISFLPPKVLQKIFPPIVTGPTVMLIGISLVGTGFDTWVGGSGPCSDANPTDFFKLCPNIAAPHALPWGSAEYIGLGFSVFVTILLMERFGSPIMKSASVIVGLLVGCIIAAATGYFDKSGITAVSSTFSVGLQYLAHISSYRLQQLLSSGFILSLLLCMGLWFFQCLLSSSSAPVKQSVISQPLAMSPTLKLTVQCLNLVFKAVSWPTD
jgi:xanthine/uracil permease